MLFFDFRRMRLMTGLYEEQTMDERLMDSYGQMPGSRTALYDLRVAGAGASGSAGCELYAQSRQQNRPGRT